MVETVNVDVTASGFELHAEADGAAHQWLDCSLDYAIIPNATAQDYLATANGDYAVEIIEGNCTDTSACFQITGVGIAESIIEQMKVFPNLVHNNLTILWERTSGRKTISIVDMQGKQAYHSQEMIDDRITLETTTWSQGIYFLKWRSDSKSGVLKIVKN